MEKDRRSGGAEAGRSEKLRRRNLQQSRYFAWIVLGLLALHSLFYAAAARGRSEWPAQAVLTAACALLIGCGICRMRRQSSAPGETSVWAAVVLAVGLFWAAASYRITPGLWYTPVFYCIVTVLSTSALSIHFRRLAFFLAAGEAFLAVLLLAGGPAGFWNAFIPTLAASAAAWLIGCRNRRTGRRAFYREQALRRRLSVLKEENRHLRKIAETDALTNVFNRYRFDVLSTVLWREAQQTGGVLSMFMIDIDRFKSFNDFYGHVRGDYCLVHAAQFIRRTCLPAGVTFRYGGEEFAVLLSGVENAAAMELAEKLRTGLEALQIPNAATGGVITVSVGVFSMRPTAGDSLSTFIDRVDRALYIAKHQGRNRVVNAVAVYLGSEVE